MRKRNENLNISKKKIDKSSSHYIFITIKINNIFILLSDIKLNKTLLYRSSENYKIKVSKRTMKESLKYMIRLYINEIQKKFLNTIDSLVLRIVAPITLRRIILDLVKLFFQVQKDKKKIRLEIIPKKCFNGCRPRKAKRKKQRNIIMSRLLMERRGG